MPTGRTATRQRANSTCLEQRGDRERRDGAVGVGDQVLHVEVARLERLWMADRDLIERPDRGKTERRLGRAQEELQHRDGRCELASADVLDVDDRPGGLVDDHLALVAEA